MAFEIRIFSDIQDKELSNVQETLLLGTSFYSIEKCLLRFAKRHQKIKLDSVKPK